MAGLSIPSASLPAPSRAERLLVLWLALTFLLCVFVALPNQITDTYAPFRRVARSYLRTLGVDQSWRLFAGEWDIPQLRIVATTASGARSDVTGLFLHHGILYRHLLDDRMGVSHLVLARAPIAPLLASYANAVRRRLGPDIRAVRFDQVFRAALVRPRSGTSQPTTVVPLAAYRWDEAASP